MQLAHQLSRREKKAVSAALLNHVNYGCPSSPLVVIVGHIHYCHSDWRCLVSREQLTVVTPHWCTTRGWHLSFLQRLGL